MNTALAHLIGTVQSLQQNIYLWVNKKNITSAMNLPKLHTPPLALSFSIAEFEFELGV